MAQNGSRPGMSGQLVMGDVHNRCDHRRIPIDQVGVSDVHYPIVVLDRQHRRQHTVAQLSMGVNLPHHIKGTHMSRFIEVLNEYQGEMTLRALAIVLRQLKERLKANHARIEMTFPYFLERVAPESGARALMGYECSFWGELNEDKEDFILWVRVPVASLCLCSKQISDYGSHNQRGFVTMEVRPARWDRGTLSIIWIEDLVEIAEASASAPVYPLLKRPDERYVTMQAYEHPAFVEDIVRGAAQLLEQNQRVSWFRVQVVNHESIHNHDVFACVEWSWPQFPQPELGFAS
jgi:GTP cyclohydrolase IB